MITISVELFERLCAAAGKSAADVAAAVVSRSGEMLVVDEHHKDFPIRKKRCCGQGSVKKTYGI